MRYVMETAARKRVEKRFRTYVDSALVDYMVETGANLDGKRQEMTVVFSDLQGFTTITEELKEQAVPLLNEYMALMIPIIRKRRSNRTGVLNKLLGDGIMFYYGAPLHHPDHARDAITAVLEMQDAIERVQPHPCRTQPAAVVHARRRRVRIHGLRRLRPDRSQLQRPHRPRATPSTSPRAWKAPTRSSARASSSTSAPANSPAIPFSSDPSGRSRSRESTKAS